MKRKCLCYALALLSVIALLPMSVISAAVSPLWRAANDNGLTASTAAVEVLDADGAHFGYYQTLEAADAVLDDGYTMKLLRDITRSVSFTLGDARPKYVEIPDGSYNAYFEESERPISYKIDGNGHRLVYKGEDAFAIDIVNNSEHDAITIRDLTVISSKGCIHIDMNSGAQADVEFWNCRFYAGNTYYMRDPAFYNNVEPAYYTSTSVEQGYIGVSLVIKGEDTEIFSYGKAAVFSYGKCSLYDGLYYSSKSNNTILQSKVDNNTLSGIEVRNTFVYGGTYLADQGAVLQVDRNTQMFVLGGKFIHLTGGDIVWSGGGGTFGHFYAYGGEMYSTGSQNKPLINQGGWGALTVGGYVDLYYPASYTKSVIDTDGGTGGADEVTSITDGTAKIETGSCNVTVSVPFALGGVSSLTLDKYTRVRCTLASVEAAKNAGYDFAVLDSSGRVLTALNCSDTPTALCSVANTTDLNRVSFPFRTFRLMGYLTPPEGTLRLLDDLYVSVTSVVYLLARQNDMHITVDGTKIGNDAPAKVAAIRGQVADGYTLQIDKDNDYMLYFQNGSITFRNINLYNATGFGFQGSAESIVAPMSCTLENATLTAKANVLWAGLGTTFNIESGSTVSLPDSYAEDADMLHLEPGGIINLNGGAIHMPACAANPNTSSAQLAIAEEGDNSKQLIFKREIPNNKKNMKWAFVYYRMPSQLNFNSGSVYYGNKKQNLYWYLPSHIDFNMSKDVTFTVQGEVITTRPHEIEGLAKIFDETGAYVTSVSRLERAPRYMKDGYTVQLQYDIETEWTVFLNVLNKDITLDGNGKTITVAGGSANAGAKPVGQNYSFGIGTHSGNIYIKDLHLDTPVRGISVHTDPDVTYPDMTLENVVIETDNDYAYAANTLESFNTRILGANTSFTSLSSPVIYNRGTMEIYDGVFSTQKGAGVLYTYHTDNDNYNDTQVTVYGGEFRNGTTSTYVLRARSADITVVGGNFYNNNPNGCVVQVGETNNNHPGALLTFGGTFYSKSSKVLSYNADKTTSRAMIVLYGGTFYQNGGSLPATFRNTTYNSSATTYTSQIFQGREVFRGLYKGPASTWSSLTANTNGNGYSHYFTCTYSGSDAGVLTVENSFVGRGAEATLKFGAQQFENAVRCVSHMGTVYLEKDVALTLPAYIVQKTYTSSLVEEKNTTHYSMNRQVSPPSFSWTLTSRQKEDVAGTEIYTLSATVNGLYMLRLRGSTVNITNVTMQNNSTTGRTLLTNLTGSINSADAPYFASAVVNVNEGGTLICGDVCALYVAGGAVANINKGGCIRSNSDSAADKTGVGADGVLKLEGGTAYVEEGAFLGCDRNGTPIGAMDTIQMRTAGSVLIVKGGTLAAKYANILEMRVSGTIDGDGYAYIENAIFKSANSTNAANDPAASAHSGDTKRYNRAAIALTTGYVELKNVDMSAVDGMLAYLWGDGSLRVLDLTYNPTTVKDNLIELHNDATGSVVIEDGDFKNSKSGNHFILSRGSAKGTVTVNGGRFESAGGANLFCGNAGLPNTTKWVFNGGEFYKPNGSTSRLMKFYGGQTVILNGGYFEAYSHNIICLDDGGLNADQICTASVTINEGVTMVGKDPWHGMLQITAMVCNVDGWETVASNARITINGGNFYQESDQYILLQESAWSTVTINGGYFSSKNAATADSLITVSNGTCNITGGYFESNALCVVRTLGKDKTVKAKLTKDANGKITKIEPDTSVKSNVQSANDDIVSSSNANSLIANTSTNATLNISGGLFHLLPAHASSTDNLVDHAACVRAGGSNTAGAVKITGGVYINDRETSKQPINHFNRQASLTYSGSFSTLQNVANASSRYHVYQGFSSTVKVAVDAAKTVTYGDNVYYYHINEGNSLPAWFGKDGGDPANDIAPTMMLGAQVRLVTDENGGNGLRFVSRFDAATVTALKKGGKVEYGTLLAPTLDVMKLTDFTLPQLEAKGVTYANVKASNGLVDDGEGGYWVRAAIVNMKVANYNRKFSAIGYAKVTAANGTVTYYYTNHVQMLHSRSISQVAAAAIADVSAVSDEEKYRFALYDFSTGTGKASYNTYSPYTREMQNGLRQFLFEKPASYTGYGTFEIKNTSIYLNYPQMDIECVFALPEFAEEIRFTTDNPNVRIENGRIYVEGTLTEGEKVKVTAKSRYCEVSKTLTVEKYEGLGYNGASLKIESEKIGQRQAKISEQSLGKVGNTQNAVLFVGDSFFDTGYWSDFYTADYYANLKAYTVGISSSTTEDWQIASERLVYPYRPKAVVVHCGTNDIFDDGDSGATTAESLKKLFNTYRERMPNVEIYWFTIEPRTNQTDDKKTEVEAANTAVKAYADTLDWLTVIDSTGWCYNDNGTINTSFYRDTVHPTLESYKLYRDQLTKKGLVLFAKLLGDDVHALPDIEKNITQKVDNNTPPITYRDQTLTSEYVISGNLHITDIGTVGTENSSYNPHIEFRFKKGSDYTYRFLIWDGDDDGKLGVAYTTLVNGKATETKEEGFEDDKYTTRSVAWKLVFTQKNAYLYLDGELAAIYYNVPEPENRNLYISTERIAASITDIKAYTKAADEAIYQEELAKVAVYEAEADATTRVERFK